MKGAGQRSGEAASIRPFASVNGIYDNGTIGVGLDQNGNIINPGGLWGVEATLGAYGTKAWKVQKIGLSYNGGYRHYTSNSYYNGSDHILALDYARQIGRRHAFMLRTNAGTTSRSLGGLGGLTSLGGLDSSFLGVPIYDIFDNRAYFAEIQGMYTLQMGTRNSLTLGASGFAVRRQSKALVGMNGQRASLDYSRRIGRYTAIGVSYQYFHVDYPRVFGEADVNSAMLTFTRAIGRAWTFGLGAGISRTDFTGVRVIQLDPVIAELLGTTSGREAFNSINTTPAIQVNVGRAFRRSSFTAMYNRSANPGNGVILLSRADTANAIYSYHASRKWTISSNFGYSKLSGFGAYTGTYETVGAGVQVGYRFWEDMHFMSGVDIRKNVVTQSDFRRNASRIFAGITYSPGDFPVSFR
jgi:hypothetical protein